MYKRLILGIAREQKVDIIEALFLAYNSFVSDKIDDYNSSFYYDALVINKETKAKTNGRGEGKERSRGRGRRREGGKNV